MSQTYHLQESETQQRAIIDTEQHKHCSTVQSVQAENWIDAKRKFGFELTDLQKNMLGL